jgi:hypothetical protein
VAPNRTLPIAVLVAALVLGLAAGVAAVVVLTRGADEGRERAPAPSGTEPFALRVLRAWDRDRARAYARGDRTALRDLYVAGSRTGARDLAVLDGYRSRGLRVTTLRTQVLGARVLSHTPRRLSLLVTDALVGGVALRGEQRWRLPDDRASTRRVLLRRSDDRWLVAEAYDVD